MKQKEAELAELEEKTKLNDFKDPTDSVIKTKSSANGKAVLSTIDNNKHVSDIDPDAAAATSTANDSGAKINININISSHRYY